MFWTTTLRLLMLLMMAFCPHKTPLWTWLIPQQPITVSICPLPLQTCQLMEQPFCKIIMPHMGSFLERSISLNLLMERLLFRDWWLDWSQEACTVSSFTPLETWARDVTHWEPLTIHLDSIFPLPLTHITQLETWEMYLLIAMEMLSLNLPMMMCSW